MGMLALKPVRGYTPPPAMAHVSGVPSAAARSVVARRCLSSATSGSLVSTSCAFTRRSTPLREPSVSSVSLRSYGL
jgi:hypothetical protein